jgi:hypothetical protein
VRRGPEDEDTGRAFLPHQVSRDSTNWEQRYLAQITPDDRDGAAAEQPCGDRPLSSKLNGRDMSAGG